MVSEYLVQNSRLLILEVTVKVTVTVCIYVCMYVRMSA